MPADSDAAVSGPEIHFPDMTRKLDALPLPDGYELLAGTTPVTDRGSKPVGDDQVTSEGSRIHPNEPREAYTRVYESLVDGG